MLSVAAAAVMLSLTTSGLVLDPETSVVEQAPMRDVAYHAYEMPIRSPSATWAIAGDGVTPALPHGSLPTR